MRQYYEIKNKRLEFTVGMKWNGKVAPYWREFITVIFLQSSKPSKNTNIDRWSMDKTGEDAGRVCNRIKSTYKTIRDEMK